MEPGTLVDGLKRFVAYRWTFLHTSPRPKISSHLESLKLDKNRLNLSLMICVQVDGLLKPPNVNQNSLRSEPIPQSDSEVCFSVEIDSHDSSLFRVKQKHICKSSAQGYPSSKPQVLKHLPVEIHLPWCKISIRLASGKSTKELTE